MQDVLLTFIVAAIVSWIFGIFKRDRAEQYMNVRIPKKITIIHKIHKKKKKKNGKNKVTSFTKGYGSDYSGAVFDNEEKAE